MNNSLENNLKKIEVGSESCENSICATTFAPPFSDDAYIVSVVASNIFGSSNETIVDKVIGEYLLIRGCVVQLSLYCILENSVQSFNHSMTHDKCSVEVKCSAALPEGICVVLYGLNSSFSQERDIVNISINTSTTLPLMQSTELYSITIRFLNDTLTGNFNATKGMYMFLC